MDPKEAMTALIKVKECLDSLGVRWTLLYGTFLGAYREKDFISWDFDIDVGALPEDEYKTPAIIKQLQEKGFKVGSHDKFIQFYYKGVPGHIMFTTYSKGPRRLWENIRNRMPDMYEIKGHTFPGPTTPEVYLKILYGNWKIPRKHPHPKASPYHARGGKHA